MTTNLANSRVVVTGGAGFLGSFVVEAFDLAAPDGQRDVGKWEFPVDQAGKLWSGALLRYEYVLPCPFQKPPANAELTVKVTFTDELTSRVFTEQKVVSVKATDAH